MFWFHEKIDQDGNSSNKVYRVSNCHILHQNTTINYEHRGGAPINHVWVCRMYQFQHGLDKIMKAIAGRIMVTFGSKISSTAVKERGRIWRLQSEHGKAMPIRQWDWSSHRSWGPPWRHHEILVNIKLHCTIGHIQYSAAILVDVEGSTLYTLDWAVFQLLEQRSVMNSRAMLLILVHLTYLIYLV